jgi:predicted  nucleic acid-binding Zn-ribbon protein
VRIRRLNGYCALIRAICAECGEAFEIGEESAGLTEFCPACGALNDIPRIEDEEPQASAEETQPFSLDQPQSPDPPPHLFVPAPRRGIPSPLWWGLIVGGLVSFIVACVFLLSDNWESRNLQTLSDAANRGDALMVDDDYPGAAAQYRLVLDTVGSRTIESVYIRQLVERARRGEAQALAQSQPRAATTSAPAVATPPATQPDAYAALGSFQLDSEAFPLFVRSRPLAFRDARGYWRRRQFVVWEVSYERQADSDPQRISLRYSCASRITEPHDDRREAENDVAFINDESPKIVHCQTLFELFGGKWVILHHDADAGTSAAAGISIRPSLDDLYVLERQAFHAATVPQ